MKDTIGGMKVSRPARSSGNEKKKYSRRNEPTRREAIAAGMFAFFQNRPNVRGASAPANTISNARIR